MKYEHGSSRSHVPARYKDRFGEEVTSILNDGKLLTMVVRGVCFRGNDFDSFEPKEISDAIDTVSEMVQETYLCPEFERRKPGTGYRG